MTCVILIYDPAQNAHHYLLYNLVDAYDRSADATQLTMSVHKALSSRRCDAGVGNMMVRKSLVI